MTLSRKQKAVLNIAKVKLGLSEREYRSALVHLTGEVSITEISQADFEAMMGFFEYLGFQPLVSKSVDYGDRPGMASFAQLELIRVLWSEYTRGEAGEDALNKWLLRTFKVSSLRFLRKAAAQRAITALKAMKARAA